MPHAHAHPVALRFVVPHGFTLTGEVVRVIDGRNRSGEAVGVLGMGSRGAMILRATELHSHIPLAAGEVA